MINDNNDNDMSVMKFKIKDKNNNLFKELILNLLSPNSFITIFLIYYKKDTVVSLLRKICN